MHADDGDNLHFLFSSFTLFLFLTDPVASIASTMHINMESSAIIFFNASNL